MITIQDIADHLEEMIARSSENDRKTLMDLLDTYERERPQTYNRMNNIPAVRILMDAMQSGVITTELPER